MSGVWIYPLLWLALFAMWLLLAGSVEPAQLLIALVVATFGSWAASLVEAPRSRLRKVWLVAVLLWRVLGDIIRSNLAVMGLVLSRRKPRSVFVTIPLALRDPNGLAILAGIITATPGSAWVDYNARASTVLVHVLDTEDDIAWGETIKRTYEALLLEIFQ